MAIKGAPKDFSAINVAWVWLYRYDGIYGINGRYIQGH